MSFEVEESLPSGTTLPLLIEAKATNGSAFAWLQENRDALERKLGQHGALLFRGFGVDAASMRNFVLALSSSIEPFLEESSPRSRVSTDVFTSTDYPASYPIQFHNEFSYGSRWPMKLFFCCVRRAPEGGATPVADVRSVLARLSASTRQRFLREGVLYCRNFFGYMGVNWRAAFSTTERAKVEEYCDAHGIQRRWEGRDGLRTQHRTAAIVRHPSSDEQLWFNHAFFFNLRAIEPPSVRDILLSQPDFSTNTFYGDGSPIEEDTIEELRQAYAAASVSVPWMVGDVLLIDNMKTAHGREAFSGERQILVSMSDGFSRSDLRAVAS